MRKTIDGVVGTQRATKHHVCSRKGCVQPILKGSEYRRVMGDDNVLRRFHIPCYTREFPSEKG